MRQVPRLYRITFLGSQCVCFSLSNNSCPMAFLLQLQFKIKKDNQSTNFGFAVMHNKNSKVKLMPNSHTEAESKRKLDIFFISIDRSSCRDSEIALDSIVSEGTLRGSRNNLIVNNATDCVLNSKF